MSAAWRSLGLLALFAVAFTVLAGRLLPRDLRQPIVPRSELGRDDEFRQLLAAIDAEFTADWLARDLQPAPRADDWTLVRRLALALTGTVPSLEEIRLLESIPADDRLNWWLDRLLNDRRTSDYLAERFARAFVGTEEGPFLVYRRRRFVTWLSDQFEARRPYDSLVRELISGTGLWTDSPAVNFLTVTNDVNGDEQPDEERLAARTARAFLGVRLDCVQCHDDHLGGDWKQADFQQLAAFFADAHSSLLGIRDRPQDYQFTYLNHDQPEVVKAETPFAETLRPTEGQRRQQLAAWVTHPENSAFARATVNRIWALMFGRPLVAPVDDVPLTGPYPPGLERLAADFSRQGYDLRRLIRTIALTQVFQRASRAPDGIDERQEQHWAAFPLSRLRPEQVAGSLLQASSLTTIDAESHLLVRLARYDQQKDFVRRYGDTGEDDFTERGGTIPQRLLLMNGQLVSERTKEDLLANAVTRIATLTTDNARAIDVCYWACLTRRPTSVELDHFAVRLRDTSGSGRRQALEDLYWTLFNSAEFTWNH